MNGRPRLADGWLLVNYAGPEIAETHLSVGNKPGSWIPAYLGWDKRQRVLKIRPPAVLTLPTTVWSRVDGHVENVGRLVR